MSERFDALTEQDVRRYLALRAAAVSRAASPADAAVAAIAERVGLLQRRRRRGRGVARLALVLAALLLAVLGAVYLSGQRERYSPDAPSVTTSLRGSPWAVATLEGSVWVAAYRDTLVFRLDPATGRVLDEVAVPAFVCGSLEPGFGYLWFGHCGSPLLSRLDPRSLAVDRLAGSGTDRVAVGPDGIWVPGDGVVERLDPVTLAIVQAIPVPGTGLLAFGAGSLWISDADGGAVHRIDPAAGEVTATITWPARPTAPYPVHLVADDDAAWVVDEHQLRIHRIDAATNDVIALPIALEPIDGTGFGDHFIDLGGGGLWVRESDRSLARIDMSTLEVVERQATGVAGGGAFAVTDDALWYADMKTQTVTGVRLP